MKKIFIMLVCLLSLLPNLVYADYYNYGVTKQEQKLIVQEEQEEKRNLLEELTYRFTEKEDYDMVDYSILTILILSMVIVIILLNEKTYVIHQEPIFEEETIKNN